MSNKQELLEQSLAELVQSVNLAENMNECLWVGDENHKTVYVNPTFEKISGYKLRECLGKDCAFFFDSQGKQTIRYHHGLRKNEMSSQYEANMLSKSGKKIPLLISGAPRKQGGTIGIFTNLTKIKKLAEKERFLSEIVKHSTEAIVILNKNRKIQLWNNGAKQIFGYKESDVLNESIEVLIPAEEKKINRQLLEEVEDRHHLKGFETRRLHKDGRSIDVSISVTKVTNAKKFLGYLIRYRDVTEQKRHNRELQKRFEAIQDAYKELGFQKRQIDYIYEIAEAATSNSSLGQLEKLIISSASLLTECDGVVLRTYDKPHDTLVLKGCLGVNQNWWNKNKISFDESLAQKAIQNGRPVIVDNVDSISQHQGIKLLKSHGFTTLVMIPLFTSNRIIGSLSLYTKDPGKFRLIETDFLQRFAQQCSLALSVKL